MELAAHLYDSFISIFHLVVEYSVLLLEAVGVCIIVGTAIKCVIDLLKKKKSNLRLHLAEGIAFALEFKLGSEVLHTLLARDLNELAVIGMVIVLRALLTFLIHWEIKMEKEHPAASNFIDTPLPNDSKKAK